MKKIFLTIIPVMLVLYLNAQEFRQAIGLRGGLTPGIEYRFYTDDTNSYKFLFSSRDNGLQLHLMKEFHRFDMFSFSDRLVFVYGIGIHGGYIRYNTERFYYNVHYYDKATAFIAGLDGLAAAEYSFREFPISLGLEVKPFFDLFGEQIFRLQPFDFAFTIKYLF
jgi:hypothetical protein